MKLSKFKVIGLIIGILLIVILIVCLTHNKPKSNEEELKNNMIKLGSTFYEEFYYTSQEKNQQNMEELLTSFSESGFKVNLKNIIKTNKADKELVDKMVNNKTNEKCNDENTYVIIYPKEPYGKTDYKIEVNLSCGY